jgi:predicted dehydrogenase
MMDKRTNRRQFLEESLLAAAAAVTPSSAMGWLARDAVSSRSAIERLGVAIVGVRGRGNSHISYFAGRRDTRVLYVCDVDQTVGRTRVREVAARQGGSPPRYEEDLRRVLEDPRVDIVTIATPNHWHALAAIWAMQAGKDVYLETPVSHNVQEGRLLVETARRCRRICQSGMQARSHPCVQAAMDHLHSGRIGTVTFARGICCHQRNPIVGGGPYPIPEGVNYDLWLGPAALAPLTRSQFHYDWHWQWPYGNGVLGPHGVHQVDLCRWGLGIAALGGQVLSFGGCLQGGGVHTVGATQVICHDFGDRKLVLEMRALSDCAVRETRMGVVFRGSDGYVVISGFHRGAVFDAEGRAISQFGGGGGSESHLENFVSAVRAGSCRQLNADIEEGHLSSALCHLGNVSFRLGDTISSDAAADQLAALPWGDDVSAAFSRTRRYLRQQGAAGGSDQVRLGTLLTCDPDSEDFPNHPAANRLLTRAYRRPFVIPGAGQLPVSV